MKANALRREHLHEMMKIQQKAQNWSEIEQLMLWARIMIGRALVKMMIATLIVVSVSVWNELSLLLILLDDIMKVVRQLLQSIKKF
jgi:hypothetical protein